MSNELAIATVTAALAHSLDNALKQDQLGFQPNVTTLPPNLKQNESAPSLNIFLFLVTPNAANRNADLPTRWTPKGPLVHPPTAALNLHYLLSFYGNDAQLEPQIILGSTVRTLHESPNLAKTDIQAVVGGDLYPSLKSSDLADEIEPVHFTPSGMSLDELSKLWTVVFQTPYVLSVVYEASFVRINREPAVAATLPVRSVPRVLALPSAQPPRVTRLFTEVTVAGKPQLSPAQPFAGATMVIIGENLAAPNTAVVIDGEDVTTSFKAVVADKKIQFTLGATLPSKKTLFAGAHTLQVVQSVDFKFPPDQPGLKPGDPIRPGGASVLRKGAVASPLVSFVLQPRVTEAAPDNAQPTKTLSVTIAPSVGQQQRLRLLLNQEVAAWTPTAASYAVLERPRKETDPQATLPFDLSPYGVTPGNYLVRVEVDGIPSAQPPDNPEGDVFPTVTIA